MSQTPPVTLVTGVSRGIGAAIADYLTARGHHIIGLARHEPEAFQGTFYAIDLADADATQSVLAEAVAKHRPLRVVNNAGLARHSPVVEAKLADFDAMMAINLRASLQVMQAVIPAMRDAHFGRIVNIGSRASLGKEGRTIYGATKAGLMGMTRTVALETIRDGITVNLIGPGPIETDMIRQSYPEGSDARANFLREIPMERFGQPKEIAAAAAYFLSDDAGFTTGQALYVCGGLTAGLAPL